MGHETDVNAVDKDVSISLNFLLLCNKITFSQGGRTPLHYAASDGRVESIDTIKYLISKGANISLSIKDRVIWKSIFVVIFKYSVTSKIIQQSGKIPLELVKDEREGSIFRNFLFEVSRSIYFYIFLSLSLFLYYLHAEIIN